MNLKVSAFYLEKQKSFIPKKNFFRQLSISKQKSFVYWLNFPEGFEFDLYTVKKISFKMLPNHIKEKKIKMILNCFKPRSRRDKYFRHQIPFFGGFIPMCVKGKCCSMFAFISIFLSLQEKFQSPIYLLLDGWPLKRLKVS